MNKCPNCGANVSSRDQVCSFCGTQNLQFLPPQQAVDQLLESGMLAYRNRQYATAVKNYRQATEMDPQVFNAYFYLAASLDSLGQTDQAIQAMEKALELRPGSTAGYYDLGLLNKQANRKEQAKASLKKALQVVEKDVSLTDRSQMKRSIQKALDDLKE